MRSDVIEKMLDAYHNGTRAAALSMTAAARVLLDEVLGPVTEKEWCSLNVFEDSEFAGYLEKFITARRAKIEQPRPAEKRVTVCNENQEWRVYKDGRYTGIRFGIKDPADIYRLGLIAQLKSKEQQ